MTSSRILARNTLWNVLGIVAPTIAALVAIPILIRHLGTARFGILSLGWAAIGYFGLFDFGLGRALTHAIASRLGRGEADEALSEIAWTALFLMLLLSIVGGSLLALFTPTIVLGVIAVPGGMVDEALTSFYLLAASLPLVVTTAGLRGLLEAHQEFGVATVLRVPLAIFTFIGPLLVVPFSSGLVPVIAVLVAVRAVTFVAHLIVCRKRFGYLRCGVTVRPRVLRPLLRYGGWMTVSNILSPLMDYLDRFIVAAILPLSAVAHYVTSFEIVNKLSVLPQAFIGAHFPAFAATFATDRNRTAVLFARSLRTILLVMFPAPLVIVLFAHEGLTAWVGAEFARASTPVLRWLAAGIFVNALAQAPFAALQGTGRPDLTGRLHLFELPCYLGSLYWLVHHFGLVGVAMAWSLRAGVDAAFLLVLASRQLPAATRHIAITAVVAFVGLLTFGVASLVVGLGSKLLFLLVALPAFGLLGWTRIVDPMERHSLRQWAGLARPR